jgi:two-component system chemotaxis response regulator CheY
VVCGACDDIQVGTARRRLPFKHGRPMRAVPLYLTLGLFMRFLIVDDSSTMRRIIINTLNRLGHQDFVEASNGREGMERLAGAPVDMIITDWNMPEMSGIDFIRAVRADGGHGEVPVLMVTTNAAKDDIVEALRAGVNNYVVKPFTSDTIKEKIDAVLAR